MSRSGMGSPSYDRHFPSVFWQQRDPHRAAEPESAYGIGVSVIMLPTQSVK